MRNFIYKPKKIIIGKKEIVIMERIPDPEDIKKTEKANKVRAEKKEKEQQEKNNFI